MGVPLLHLRNGEAADRAAIPLLSPPAFRRTVLEEVAGGSRLCSFFGLPGPGGGPRFIAVLAGAGTGTLSLASADLGERYEALTPDCPQAHLFERELLEQWGVRPEGHPWPKPVRSPGAVTHPVGTDFYRVEGDAVHEVAVGPVHAGVIEPGHFRFQCHGEEVLHLEIALGYQHRGVERALRGGPGKRSVHHAETLAGDTTIGHATAYAAALEALAGVTPPPRADAVRAVALELERCANHAGDLGALAGDVGYLPTASFCGRIRGDFLNMTALLCGSRFGRGLVRPGGTAFDLDEPRAEDLLRRLETAIRDERQAAALLWASPAVMGRFESAGPVSRDEAVSLGLVGVTARACGLERDVRQEFPSGVYRFSQVPVSTWHTGDVFARAWVRQSELERSVRFLRDLLPALPSGPVLLPAGRPAPDRVVVSLVEGWRGEICHVALTDSGGRFAAYKVCDPSFHNWMALAVAMRGRAISDFPLVNKSFDLSYCGHDL